MSDDHPVLYVTDQFGQSRPWEGECLLCQRDALRQQLAEVQRAIREHNESCSASACTCGGEYKYDGDCPVHGDPSFASDQPSSAPAAGRIAVEDFNDLRKWIQERMQGGCRVFSKGSDCRCPLCLLERVAEGSLPLAADQPSSSASVCPFQGPGNSGYTPTVCPVCDNKLGRCTLTTASQPSAARKTVWKPYDVFGVTGRLVYEDTGEDVPVQPGEAGK